MSLMTFLTWMDNLPSSIALRESTWTYPLVESIHSVGICLFVGLTLLWDLRLLGVGACADGVVAKATAAAAMPARARVFLRID